MGASSRSPSPMTMVPSISTWSMVLRMASTATSSALWRSPKPMVRAAAMAPFSTTRRNSRLSCSSIVAPSADAILGQAGLNVDRGVGSDGANPITVRVNHTPAMESLYLFFARKWTNKPVDEEWIGKLGHFAGAFFLYGEEACGERLVPLDGKRCDVADDAGELLDGGVPGKRNGVEAGGANGGVAEELVERETALVPTLRENGILQDGQHDAGIACAARANFFQRGGD